MATVINNPSTESTGSGTSMVVGLVLAIIVAFLFFAYGLPALRNSGSTGSETNINVPDDINVDVNKGTTPQ